MWTTRNNETLVVPASTVPRIISYLRRVPALQRYLQRPDSDTGSTVAAILGRMLGRAVMVRSLRDVSSGRTYSIFRTHIAHQPLTLRGIRTGPNRYAIVQVRGQILSEPETESGPGQAGLHWLLWNQLLAAGLKDAIENPKLPADQVVRWGQPQVVSDGSTVNSNKPDLSYVAKQGRVNVEIDTNRNNSIIHQNNLIKADPDSRHIFLVVDRTGKVLERREYLPPVRKGDRGRIVVRKAGLAIPAPATGKRQAPARKPLPKPAPTRRAPRRPSRELEMPVSRPANYTNGHHPGQIN